MTDQADKHCFRIRHTMLRVTDLERSIAFTTGQFGMTLFRTERYPQGRFALAFVGYGNEENGAAIEQGRKADHPADRTHRRCIIWS